MKSSFLSASLLSALLITTAADARVCMVSDFDLTGCRKGDEVLYMPNRWGNEQLPINFIAVVCDMSKQIAYNNTAVACIYAGRKNIVDLHQEAVSATYKKRFDAVAANPAGWLKVSDSEYWRNFRDPMMYAGTGEKIKLGDGVEIFPFVCEHSAHGSEHRSANPELSKVIDSVTETHFLWQSGPLVDGTIIEVVQPDRHLFLYLKKHRK